MGGGARAVLDLEGAELVTPVKMGQQRELQQQLVVPRVLDRRDPVPLQHKLIGREHA